MGNTYSILPLNSSTSTSTSTLTWTSINRLDFAELQKAIKTGTIMINTIDSHRQQCLIKNTIHADREIEIINRIMEQNAGKNGMIDIKIIIYGENSCDMSIIKKYHQLWELGFRNIHVYIGGLFEWLLLQDIFGETEFPTTSKINNPLIYGHCNRLLLQHKNPV